MSFLMMLLAFLDAYKHPLIFLVNASAEQSFSGQNLHTSTNLPNPIM
jgi:hypothetical protein